MHQQNPIANVAIINTVNLLSKGIRLMDSAAIPVIASLLIALIASSGSSDSQHPMASLSKDASMAHNHMIAQQALRVPAPAPTPPVIAAVGLGSDILTVPLAAENPAPIKPPHDFHHNNCPQQQKSPRTKLQNTRKLSNNRTRH